MLCISSTSSSLPSSLSSQFGVGTEIKFTHFLISAPFIETHTLLSASLHSLKHPTQIASRRAGLIFNSRYDLNAPRFIVLNNAPAQATACFPLSDDQRNMIVLFILTFTLCLYPSYSGTPDASSYILMFTSPFLAIHSV